MIGFSLEEIARIMIPGYLERHLAIHLEGPLGEELQPWLVGPEGAEVEFDFYGEGRRNGQKIVVLGEVKSRIYSEDVRRLAQRVEQVRDYLPKEVLPILFGFVVHPVARQEGEKRGVLVLASYQR